MEESRLMQTENGTKCSLLLTVQFKYSSASMGRLNSKFHCYLLLKENNPYRLPRFVKVNTGMNSKFAVWEEDEHVGELKCEQNNSWAFFHCLLVLWGFFAALSFMVA